MASLIFLTGYTGTGKTTILKQYRDRALCLMGDELQLDAVRRAFPFIRKPYLYNWKSWPKDPSTMHLELLLFTSLNSVCPQIRDHDGHILTEGTIFATEWFRDALISALGANGKTFNDSDVHFLYLRPPHEQVFANVQKRLESASGRENERRKLSTLENVEMRMNSYEKAIAGHRWKRCDTSEAVHKEINTILNSEATEA